MNCCWWLRGGVRGYDWSSPLPRSLLSAGDARVTPAKLTAPPDEARRLEVLAQYGILDTTPEQEFDDLARLATYIAGTPMAMVSLIDADRQWFKSKIGVSIDQAPRAIAFCDHAIRGRELFIVPDTQADPRFARNPLVTGEPHIRFYAGMPLLSPEGTALGTLCVVDRVPRQLSLEQQEALRVLGRQVNAQLDLRRNMLKLVRTYAELAGAQEKLAAVLHSATTVAIIATDMHGVVTLFNPGAERLLGWPAEEVIGKKSALDFLLGSEIEERAAELGRRLNRRIRGLAYFAELARQGIHEERPWMHVRKDGSHVPAKLAVAALHDANGEISGFLGVSKDLTERRRYEQQLIQAREAAEVASRTKSEFLANISHEIRTPLNAILGLAELAMGTAPAPEQREYLAGIQESGRGLLALMNDVLDFSRIENRKLELYTINFPLRETLADILRTFGLRAYQKGLELILQVGPDVPEVVCADAMRLRQILTNLVGNAIKFTERGEIVLRVFVDLGREDHTLLHFSVADSGIGIPPAKLAIIFDPFTQADSSTHRKYGGTGLGLAISKELVEWMGGQMWVESAPGRGSTFHFSLPVRGRLAPPAAPQGNLAGLAVLVADDNRTQRDTLCELLARRGLKTESAAGGRAAGESLEAAVKNDRLPALVLLDAHMPEVDGFAVAERLRALRLAPGQRLPAIVLLTAPGMPDSEARRAALGIAAAVSKPVRESALFDAIAEALHARSDAPAPARSQRHRKKDAIATPARRALRILLIEDNAVNQLVTTRLLEREGHSVAGAESGLRGLEALARESFDAVLMDVQMPGMDGIETTRAIRARERGVARRTPIIAFTAHAMKEDRERCLAAGMDAYLAKPVETAELIETLARVTALPGGKAGEGPVTGRAAAPAEPAGVIEDPHVAALLRIVGGDEKLLREVVRVFLEDGPAKLSALNVALDARDSNALAVAAHGLKGSAAAIGARAATDAAAHLEALARARNLAEADVAAAQVREEISRVRDSLSSWLAPQPG
jgi:PAS domain S-box-containing protein